MPEDMKSFRTLRMVGAISALLAGLYWLYRVWDIWDSAGDPIARHAPGKFLTTWYGLGVAAQLGVRVGLAAVLLWLFVRLGSSKPLPRLSRSVT